MRAAWRRSMRARMRPATALAMAMAAAPALATALAVALVAMAALAGCGDDSSGPPRFDLSMPPIVDLGFVPDGATAASAIVQIGPGGNNVFAPATVTVHAGDTVAWRWVSGTHSVVSDSMPKAFADSPTQAAGVFNVTFASAGTFPYHCGVHGAMMSGTVIVK